MIKYQYAVNSTRAIPYMHMPADTNWSNQNALAYHVNLANTVCYIDGSKKQTMLDYWMIYWIYMGLQKGEQLAIG